MVRNSTKNSVWEEEEREVPSFPFKSGHTFDLVFIARADRIEVSVGERSATVQTNVDGLPFTVFRYRPQFRASDLTSVTVNGDLSVQTVQLI